MTTEPGSIGDKWVKWDKATCSMVPADPQTSWQAVLRPAKGLRVGFGEQNETGGQFAQFNAGVKDTAAKAGIELVIANYQSPDAAKAVAGAQLIVTRHPEAVISYNVVAAAMPGIMAAFNKECIPVVQITSPAPNAVVFGPNNTDVGAAAGEFLAKLAADRGWKADETTVLSQTTPSLGADINLRPGVCSSTIAKAMPGVGTSTLELPAPTTADGQSKMTDWLTANPDKKHVLVCTIADLMAFGINNATKAAGRTDQVAVIGIGGSPDGSKLLESGNSGSFVGTVDFQFGKYGNYAVPMVQDLLAGKAIPSDVRPQLTVVAAK
jgi:ribose transport system substrate-binding protein